MPRKRLVGLSAGEAILGLVIEQPDSASRLGSRLVERFRSAQFTRSTAHNALSRLARQGLVQVIADEDGPDEHRYEATPLGVEHFRAWLRACTAAAPALREELHAKVEFCTAADLPQLIEAICAEERACASMFAAAQGRLSEAELVAPRCATAEQRWSALARRAVLRDEAALWGTRFKRLERLRARLEELGEVAEEPAMGHNALPRGTTTEAGRHAPPALADSGMRAERVSPQSVPVSASAHALGRHPTHVDDPPR
jgi:DNA-binding PadR family transcriptional regulator